MWRVIGVLLLVTVLAVGTASQTSYRLGGPRGPVVAGVGRILSDSRLCSAFRLDGTPLVISAGHCVQQGFKFKVPTRMDENLMAPGGTELRLVTVGVEGVDVAVYDDASPAPGLKLALAEPELAEEVFIIGFCITEPNDTKDISLVALRGSYSGSFGHSQKYDFHVEPGFSGGPILNSRGRVVGIITSGQRGGENWILQSPRLAAIKHVVTQGSQIAKVRLPKE